MHIPHVYGEYVRAGKKIPEGNLFADAQPLPDKDQIKQKSDEHNLGLDEDYWISINMHYWTMK